MSIGVVLYDHGSLGRSLARLLEAEAPDVEVVGVTSDGEELDRLVGELLPDVVVMPVRMAGQSGTERIRRVRSVSPTTRVVLLASRDYEADLYAALRAGAWGYVGLTDSPATIAGAVRSVCRGQVVIPAHLAGVVLRDLGDASPLPLTSVERDVLGGMERGETTKEIGVRLRVSERAVHRRVEDIFSKLHLVDRVLSGIGSARHSERNQAVPATAGRLVSRPGPSMDAPTKGTTEP